MAAKPGSKQESQSLPAAEMPWKLGFWYHVKGFSIFRHTV